MLETLAAKSVPATFFLVGRDVVANPDLVQQIANAGHEIGNHSFTHPRMLLMRPSRVAREIERTDAAIRDTGYQSPLAFRPPFGKKLITLPWYLSKAQRPSIMWSIAPEKWSGPIKERVERVAQELEPGAIILLHVMYESGQGSRDLLAPMIDAVKAQGYQFVTLSALLKSADP